MKCAKCDNENPAEAAFCMKCGNALQKGCKKCGAEILEGAAFCMKCGTPVEAPAEAPTPTAASPDPSSALEQYIPKELMKKLEAARSGGGMRGERRVVTILFCDVKGSTAAAEKLDPEEWADIMNDAFEYLIAPVYRYEGMLARLMGDAVLAFFGAPISHEDDPERAVLAGLSIIHEIGPYKERIKAKWGIDFDVRVGINTGLVVVGEVGTDMRLEYTAMGDEVNLAARMEQTADPGTVQISQSTHKHIEPLFDFEDLGGIEIKGKSEPVHTWRVLGKKVKPGRLRGVEGLESPMVGRDAELGQARSQVEDLRRGTGQILSLIGEAGLGKSRLLSELKASAHSHQEDPGYDWLEVRSVSYETQTPYASFARFFKELFALDGKAPQDRYPALKAGLEDTAPGSANLAPFIARMIDVEVSADDQEVVQYLSPPDLKANIQKAVAEYLERRSLNKPVLLVLEDLHWADPSSCELSLILQELAERAPLMVVALFRPRRQEAAWSFHEEGSREYAHRYHSIHLRPLDDTQARVLVKNLLAVEGLSDSMREMILKRAEGNPFFVEEVIRSLMDGGFIVHDGDTFKTTQEIEKIEVPTTLAALLNTRLDALDEDIRGVAQTAAVLGREFDYDTLASMHEAQETVDAALAELQKRGLAREKARFPTRLWGFKHVLIRDAAYESLLKKTRRQLHKQAAEVLLRIAPEKSLAIGQHFVAARENDLALPHLLDGAESAAARYANDEATAAYEQALTLLEASPNPALIRRAREGLGEVQKLTANAEGAWENYQALLTTAEAAGDGSMRASALNKLSFVKAFFMADLKEGEALLNRARESSIGASCKTTRLENSMLQCAIQTTKAEFSQATEYLKDAAKLGEQLGAINERLYGMTHIANTLVFMTEYDRAWDQIEDTLALAKEHNNLQYEAELRCFSRPACLARNGKIEEAAAELDAGLALAGRIHAAIAEANGLWLRSQLAIYRGEFELAKTLSVASMDSGARAGYPWIVTGGHCSLGTTYLQISERLHPQALKAHDDAVHAMKQPLGDVMAAANQCELGFCAMGVGKVELAEELFEKALSTPSTPMFLCKPHLHLGAAMVRMMRGDLDGAAAHLEEGRTFTEEKAMKQYLPFMDLGEGQLKILEGNANEALAAFEKARDGAVALGFWPLAWQSAAHAAEIQDNIGQPDAASQTRDEARGWVNDIAGRFEDPSLRQLYLDSALPKVDHITPTDVPTA
jgi:class 3 adenylate cyclase